jgi:hypothetical protein
MVRLLLGLGALALTSACARSDSAKLDTADGPDVSCESNPAACDEDADGFLPAEGDCDDNDPDVNPTAPETCDGVDQDCDGLIDENVETTYYDDLDGDGFGDPDTAVNTCEPTEGQVQNGDDCDDAEPLAYPYAAEACDGLDNDCDGTADEGVLTTFYTDSDGDTYGDGGAPLEACEAPLGYVTNDDDCDDSTQRSQPGNPETCDELDNDCNGLVDDGVNTRYYADVDSDGFGDASYTQDACTPPTGYVLDATDCNDRAGGVNPGATEVCNSIDDDCDTVSDEPDAADAPTWYLDADTDGYGTSATSIVQCEAPTGHVLVASDCDDARALTNPGATEFCNGIDDNCNGVSDEDGSADEISWYFDGDRDGFGDPSDYTIQCSPPSGHVADGSDCDDTRGSTYPGADETCDGLDNDCDGTVDDVPTDGIAYYADLDGDGFGDPSSTVSECSLPSGYVTNGYDCTDVDPSEPVVADIARGSASGTGRLTNPFDRVQDAIDMADSCVVVYAGTYNEQLDLGGKNIDVWGVEGAESTIVDANLATCSAANPTACGAAVSIASASNATPTLHGFTITGGTGAWTSSTASTTCADSSASHSGANTCTVTTYEYCGGGLYVDGDDPFVYDVIVRDNVLPDFEQARGSSSFRQSWLYSFGGGVCLRGSNASFATTLVEGNQADQGGGLYAEDGSNFSFEQGTVSENDATDGGGVNLTGASAAFSNAIIACNAASTDGGGLFTERSGTVTFLNAALYGNTSSTVGTARGSQAYIGASTTFNLYNAIAEASSSAYAIYGAGGSGAMDYDNVSNTSGSAYGGTLSAGTGALSSGSNFTSATCDGNPYNDDFSLRGGSVSIDAGNPDAAYDDADGSRNDMGAYGGPNGTW